MPPVRIAPLALLLAAILAPAQDPSWLDEQPPSLWSSERRDAGFRQMHKVYKTNTVPAGGKVHVFATGKPLATTLDLDAYMDSQRSSGLIIIHDNKIRFEKYARGFTRHEKPAGQFLGYDIFESGV